jgi:hypothetical protein
MVFQLPSYILVLLALCIAAVLVLFSEHKQLVTLLPTYDARNSPATQDPSRRVRMASGQFYISQTQQRDTTCSIMVSYNLSILASFILSTYFFPL